MRIRTEFPRRPTLIENTWIPMPDGCRLAARIWLPADAMAHPVPAIVDYVPYRKSDGTAVRDAARFPWFAGNGYAGVRVDIRGSGDSDGILLDEYLPLEQDDGEAMIAWLAAQPWCNGNVGMIGISWGGFSALQVAARRPPALKAIITMCSTDDRYADDVHYKGGCVIGLDMLPWASSMMCYLAQPPDPAVVGDGWRDQWLDRLERTPAYIEHWLGHQHRDDYWRQGSVCEDPAAIECAVYAVGGWADGYTNAIPRLLAELDCPRKGLIGPWSHAWPEDSVPGPSIGFLQEAVRFFDHWLKDVPNGVMAGPMLRAWMQEGVPPRRRYLERPGRWVAEDVWPSPRIESRRYALNAGTIDAAPGARGRLQVVGVQTAGLDAGAWCADGGQGDWPGDQRAEDGMGATFTSAPLAEAIEILGFASVTLELTSNKPRALVAVRLCDVAPDGTSTLVTRSLLNLCHRGSHASPEPLAPGHAYTVEVKLDAIAHVFAAGRRLRVSVSPTYWPWAWPSPEPVTLTILTGGPSALVLPVRPPRGEDADLPAFDEPEQAAPLGSKLLDGGETTRVISLDTATGIAELRFDWGGSTTTLLEPSRTELLDRNVSILRIDEADPLSATVRCEVDGGLAREGWRTRVDTVSEMSCDAETFHVTTQITAWEGAQRVFERRREFEFPRELV